MNCVCFCRETLFPLASSRLNLLKGSLPISAGSHGVWGLDVGNPDVAEKGPNVFLESLQVEEVGRTFLVLCSKDYHMLPFLFGAAQLIGKEEEARPAMASTATVSFEFEGPHCRGVSRTGR